MFCFTWKKGHQIKRKKISFPYPFYNCELLVPDLQGDIEFVLVNLEANRITEDILPHIKCKEECDYVLKGEITITLKNKEYILENKSGRYDCLWSQE